MKKKEFQELKMKSRDELLKLVDDHREKLRIARFDLQMKKLQNVRTLKVIRKDLARLLTVLKTK